MFTLSTKTQIQTRPPKIVSLVCIHPNTIHSMTPPVFPHLKPRPVHIATPSPQLYSTFRRIDLINAPDTNFLVFQLCTPCCLLASLRFSLLSSFFYLVWCLAIVSVSVSVIVAVTCS